MTAGAWRFRASPRGRWRHRPRVGARAPRHREAEQPAQGHTASDPGFVAIALRVALVGHSSSSSSCTTLPSGHSPEAWSSPSPARRGGAAGRGAHPEADGGCARGPQAVGWRWGQALAASPGCHSGRFRPERASVCPTGPRAARPAVRQPELPPALRHPGRSRWVQAESRGTGRDSPAGPQPAGSDPHVGQNPRGREGQTLDLRVGRSGRWGGVCVVGPLVLGSGFLGLRVFI